MTSALSETIAATVDREPTSADLIKADPAPIRLQ
jgi:hypothetical protein